MNRNARKIKKANHGKRAVCSSRRRAKRNAAFKRA
ncbi:MAG: 50S ribosomal protein L37 [Planctomycetota bacterium]